MVYGLSYVCKLITRGCLVASHCVSLFFAVLHCVSDIDSVSLCDTLNLLPRISLLTIWAFNTSSAVLLFEHPKVSRFYRGCKDWESKLLSRKKEANVENKSYQDTLREALRTQLWLSNTMCLLLMVASFGVLVPALLILFSVGVYTNLCALCWLEENPNRCSSFGHNFFGYKRDRA